MLSEGKLKNFIKTKATQYGTSIPQMYALYGLEQLLKKLNDSPYRDHLIVKGGYLLASRYGLDTRSTNDLDTTVRDMALNEKMIHEMVDFISQTNEQGKQEFSLLSIKETRKNFFYNGYALKLNYHLSEKSKVKIDLDITAGEDLLIIDEASSLPLMFEEGTLNFPTYPIEQIIADKIYTTATMGDGRDDNSRAKDLYDIYFLTKFQPDIDYSKVYQAVKKSQRQKESTTSLLKYPSIIAELTHSDFQKENWARYMQRNEFAKELSFETVMDSVMNIAEIMKSKEPTTNFFNPPKGRSR